MKLSVSMLVSSGVAAIPVLLHTGVFLCFLLAAQRDLANGYYWSWLISLAPLPVLSSIVGLGIAALLFMVTDLLPQAKRTAYSACFAFSWAIVYGIIGLVGFAEDRPCQIALTTDNIHTAFQGATSAVNRFPQLVALLAGISIIGALVLVGIFELLRLFAAWVYGPEASTELPN
ncbi:MAG: hypothetical protein K2Z81_03915 [Cyanobacteria bacterium]|nr:hypothetical protein [Cyanobacteriota bacterium]